MTVLHTRYVDSIRSSSNAIKLSEYKAMIAKPSNSSRSLNEFGSAVNNRWGNCQKVMGPRSGRSYRP